MEIPPLDLFLGLFLSVAVAWTAYRRKSLSRSGFCAAAILGSLIYIMGKPLMWIIMILFFVSSSLLSKYRRQEKAQTEQEFAKTGCRDWLQVLANGAAGLGYAAAWRLTNNPVFVIGYIAAFATVNADTWATEIGILSKKPPVSILTLKESAPGVSGAVSLLGTGAAVAGAAFIALLASLGYKLFGPGNVNLLAAAIAGTLGGAGGCLADSFLGATVQAMYRCRVCSKLTEKKEHHGQPAQLVRGFKFMENDMVNFFSSLLGSLLGIVLALVF